LIREVEEGFSGVSELRRAFELFRELSAELGEALAEHRVAVKELARRVALALGGEATVEVAAAPGQSFEVLAAAPGSARQDLSVLLEALVGNALEAAAGHVQVRLTREGDVLRLAVADDGPGLPAVAETRLFAGGLTTKPAGTGEGLATARRLATRYGGTLVSGSDEPLGGACFTVELPVPLSRRGAPEERP
jgi:signal transduction histidine kinase